MSNETQIIQDDLEEDSIERCPHDKENPYVMISRNLIRDNSISPECRLMIIYLLSMDEKKWKINPKQLINYFQPHWGRDKVYEWIEQAIDAGYMKKEEVKNSIHPNLKGKVKYYVSETPKFKKCFRHPEMQYTEARDPENQYYKKEHVLKNDHSKETTTSEYAVVFSCLENVKIDKSEKEWLSTHYDESIVKHAIAYVSCPHVKIRESLIQAIKWACKVRPEIPTSTEQNIEKNKELAEKIRLDAIVPNGCRFEVLNKCIEICFDGNSNIFVLNYSEVNFKEKFKEALKKYRITSK